MFRRILLCITQLWDVLCESISSSTPSQTPSSFPLDSVPSTTISQAPSSTVSNARASKTSQTPSSSASFSTCWDVFLSFRGEDTRLNFTGHLYQRLHDHGINTFKDDPELHSGEVISDALLDAIRNSKAYIVVFSENYATSPWCLDELAEILNCHRTMQRWVIPVFFNIDPSVVRHQTGSFQKAFKKHQKRFGGEREKLENWQLTLKEVAGFSGHHVSKDRSEADVINEIVDELLLKINPKTLDVTKFPVGLDSRVEAITKLLSSDTEGVIKFGIYGMGGVGKTTLAKALYNQLVGGGSFKGSCFLANVREASGTFKGLESLQQQLINDVLRCTTKVEVHNVDQGIKLIEARICSTKVVVVVDDLDDLNHLQLLVGPFASGSVVIITTRDKEILDKTEVETSYQYLVNTLDDADSLALFMQHAFGNAEPSHTLMELSKDILRLAAGLPLALEIFGSHLFKKSEVGWKDYIEKLQRIPNNIQQRLEISLDALESDDPALKKVFLDIACFFIGWEKQEVVHIMESYYSYADHSIDMLKKRCLLTINDGWLGMHDLLRDVGKEIVRNSSPDEPRRRSRLWASNDICDVLKNQNGTKEIECIICRYGECALDGVTLNADTFKRMRKLRFLKFEKVNLTGSLEQKFEDLRWLNWKHCPLECLPSEFYPQKLAILELTYSNIRTMWEVNMVTHVFGNLKTVKMSHSKYLITTPDFTKLPCLETLDLELCESLEEVHMSIGSLARLVSLNLKGCKRLRSLPDTICDLRALKVLKISKCNSLEALPVRLGNIESLTELKAGGLSVSKLPDSIGSLTKLVELNLNNSENLETLPDTIGNLRSLETLSIKSCTKLQTLPDELWKITRLRKLIAICEHLVYIPKLPPNLLYMCFANCESLERLPNLSNLKQLEELNLNCSSGLTNIQGLEDLISIREIDFSGCSGLTHRHLPKQLFKVYSAFGRQINVQVPEFMHSGWLDWIAESPYWTIKSNKYPESTTVCANLLPNESHNFMGIILCFEGPARMNVQYSVKNTTSGFIWSSVGPDLFIYGYGSLMVIVPKSIFSVTDDDHRIEFTTHDEVKIVGIHLLYNTRD
ncbi:hypothetical protein AgCh_037676 [Apium graveolens]